MAVKTTNLMGKRRTRHVLFWMAWVFGFTFLKSMEASFAIYVSWFAYYLFTLPLFIGHTYLVAYVLVPRFFTRRKLPYFILGFLLALYVFSMAEMWLTLKLIMPWFSLLPASGESFLNPLHVVRSGIGNLYIVLIFLAAKNLWDWSRSSIRERELQQGALQVQMKEAMTRVQPLMLLYAIEHIERMVEEKRPEISHAIAQTSELLSEVMIYHEEGNRWMAREIELVSKLIDLNAILRDEKAEVEFFISGDMGKMDLPPMILFSIVDLIFRNLDSQGINPEIHIEASGLSNLISIEVLFDVQAKKEERFKDCMKAISQMKISYQSQVEILTESHPYGCTVLIKATHHAENDDCPVVAHRA